MKIKRIRILLRAWGLICLLVPAYTVLLQSPIIKITTPDAVALIENQFINKESMDKKEMESYESMKRCILGNDEVLRISASRGWYAVSFIGLSSAIFCYIGADSCRT